MSRIKGQGCFGVVVGAVTYTVTCLHLLTIQAAAAESSQNVQFSVRWSGDADRRPTVELDDSQSQVPLSYDPAKSSFDGIYAFPESVTHPEDVTLTATYPDSTSSPLFLRVRPGLTVSATLFHSPVASCTPQNLGRYDQSSGSVETALKYYFAAMSALQIQGADGCGTLMRKLVEKAWFDRSYELATMKNYFRLSIPAAQASREYQLAYPDPYIDQDTGLAFKFANDWKLDAASHGDFPRASAINRELISGLQADAHYASIVRRLQYYNLDRLNRDAASLSVR